MGTELKSKPKASTSLAEKELDNCEKQFEAFEDNVNKLTLDRMNEAPKQEVENQTKISQRDIEKSVGMYLKPFKVVSSRDKFNEKFRKDYEYQKEYVHFTAQNNEIIGEALEFWTRPFGGMPAELWKVPVNKPVWAPRYVAEQIKGTVYHRLVMQENVSTGTDGHGQYYGQMAADTTIQRLDAFPVSEKKSVFMGSNKF